MGCGVRPPQGLGIKIHECRGGGGGGSQLGLVVNGENPKQFSKFKWVPLGKFLKSYLQNTHLFKNWAQELRYSAIWVS